jgi:hypothetical protein
MYVLINWSRTCPRSVYLRIQEINSQIKNNTYLPVYLVHAPSFWWSPSYSFTFSFLCVFFQFLYVVRYLCLCFLCFVFVTWLSRFGYRFSRWTCNPLQETFVSGNIDKTFLDNSNKFCQRYHVPVKSRVTTVKAKLWAVMKGGGLAL